MQSTGVRSAWPRHGASMRISYPRGERPFAEIESMPRRILKASGHSAIVGPRPGIVTWGWALRLRIRVWRSVVSAPLRLLVPEPSIRYTLDRGFPLGHRQSAPWRLGLAECNTRNVFPRVFAQFRACFSSFSGAGTRSQFARRRSFVVRSSR